ncbi:conserved Plasmodium protein, unknown function [Plasmodium knowlesi strain H]|uniref:Uncharacterized protein n=3 Tax=Plasmodium knowlesi TaxID=5850 RepID=A0A1A7W6I6_PLAKH|nr:conserved Plasmodium protein, unknown function [Plasmodium knowlesi strain H]OTN68488.1 Uncharacterized protein PKNOH_S02304900 [Plasmodium knowlesi]CAA9986550.1 conserved Plasmodium protein, unknown function [Plasmodium knowlesi strain H]SBO24182.1 conserved Plasmodium protein, unknown function [Plasmodium knowlesi strain H]SBO29796.1 conserved Plasmodium protein, unknown function [Plasmodium knowlesi strain H]VVS76024.1 conserved Plasmodium protein, unknown function [Plasmodium knowlesi s
MEVAKLKEIKRDTSTGRRIVAPTEVEEEGIGSMPVRVGKIQSKGRQAFGTKEDDTDVSHGKSSNMKKLFNGIIGSQMKHAKNVIEGVKEHLRCTAKGASKNMNYPFCKSPCNIEDLKNTIYINEGEIIIRKNAYKNLFNSRREDNKETKETPDLKKNSNEDIFSCKNRDIIFRGTHNFGFHVELSCENEENKIIAYAYDTDTKKRIPCVYRWTRIYSDQTCNMVSRSFANSGIAGNGNIIESVDTVGSASDGGSYSDGKIHPEISQYGSEYELTCDDIGLKICVECSYLNYGQLKKDTRCKYPRNNVENSIGSWQESDASVDGKIVDQSGCSDVQLYNDISSFKNSFTDSTDPHPSGVNPHDLSTFRRGDRSSGPSRSSSRIATEISNHYTSGTNERGDLQNIKKEPFTLDPYESSLREKNFICAPTQTNNDHPPNNLFIDGKYTGVAVAEVGPFTLNEKTKRMLQTVIQNDIIRYPIYVVRKSTKDDDKVGKAYERDSINIIPSKGKNRIKGLDAYNDCTTSVDEHSLSSNVDSEQDDHLYMLHIHKNEIKLVSQSNITTQMWSYKFSDVYPYVEFSRRANSCNDEFFLHTSDREYCICKCLHKRHRDLIAIILRYMHANLQILNDYIFNNINESFENKRAKNIFDNVDVNSILENVNRELLTHQKLNQKYLQKIKKLRGEKNILEEDLKNTIEAFQAQLDTVKRFKDENELVKTNEHLMKEIKLLQDKYKNVDLFFKNKYKLLLNDIERYKKLVDERKTKVISQEAETLRAKLEAVEHEKNDLRRETAKIKRYYEEEKKSKIELQNRLEELSLKMENLKKSLEEEKSKGESTSGCMKEIEELRKNNIILQQKNVAISDQVNILVTEKNRLSKMVDSLTKDIEKAKTNGGLRSAEGQKKGPKSLPSDDPNQSEEDNHQKLLKEVASLRGENELLKKRIKKFAKINSMA